MPFPPAPIRFVRSAVLVSAIAIVAGCASSNSPSAASPSSAKAGSPPSVVVPATGSPSGTDRAAPRTRLEGYREITITVVGADGMSRTFCLLLADSEPLRQQGLMRVSDQTLGGYDGMLFAWPADVAGGFWMKNTLIPLSIAYLRADGTTVSTTDMSPCAADQDNCPSYPSGGRYRNAIEVPQGQLSRLGIDDRSRVTLGDQSCA